jgi:hypothetical protein
VVVVILVVISYAACFICVGVVENILDQVYFQNRSFQKIKQNPRYFLEAPVVPYQLVD